jgi:quinol-cytochrome oxidoreductase complex cytochrome b subunit
MNGDTKNFREVKEYKSKVKPVILSLIVLLCLGLCLDGCSGFYILRKSKNILAALGGFVLLGILYIAGEGVAEWLHSKDKVTHPHHKRAFHLILLLLFVAIFIVLTGLIYKLFGWKWVWE